MEQLTSSKLGKEKDKAVYRHFVYLTYIQSTSCEMPDWMKHKPESRLLGEKYQQPHDTTVMAESEEELKSQKMTVKKESEKADLKLNVGTTRIMASSPITSWQIEVEKSGSRYRFYFLGLQNHCGWECHREIKGYLLLGKKAMTYLDSILKSRDISLPTKVHIVKAVVFPVVIYRCESWTIKKAEH